MIISVERGIVDSIDPVDVLDRYAASTVELRRLLIV